MPARSNTFQRAMVLLRRRLADAGCEVLESGFLTDPETGGEREVDILIRREVAGLKVVIAVECVGRSRKADVGWVEQMHGKHLRLGADALVLASESGFTAQAASKAKERHIRTVDITEVPDDLGATIVGVLESIEARQSDTRPSRVRVTVGPTGELPRETFFASAEQSVYDQSGRLLGPLLDFVLEWLRSRTVGDFLHREAVPEHKFMTLTCARPDHPRTGGGLFLQKLEPLCLRRIESIEVTAVLRHRRWEIRLQHALVDGRAVAWGEGENGETRGTVLIDETPGEPSAVVWHVEGSTPDPASDGE